MKSIAAILACLALAHIQHVSAKIKVLHKSHVNLEKRLVFDPMTQSHADERLTYALCDKNPPGHEVECTVIREKRPYSDDTYSCNVTLKRGVHTGKYEPEIELVPFGKHSVALYSWELGVPGEKKFLRFSIVQLDSCKVAEAKIDTASELSHWFDYTFVGHSDSFDVFFGNDKVFCEGKTCKATVSADGKLAEAPRPSVGKLARSDFLLTPSIVALDDGTAAKRYFYFMDDKHDYVQVLVKPDGTEKSLSRHPKPDGDIAVSTKNNLIGVCYQTNSEYKCSQYDFEGNLKLQTEIHRTYENLMQLLGIHNSQEGGFYVVSRMCGRLVDGYIGECGGGIHRFFIERIDANGVKSKPLTVQIPADYLDDAYHTFPFIYENESQETCLSLATYDSTDSRGPTEGKGHLYLTANCFTEADFSK